MPIFEYRCKDCNTTFDMLVKSNDESEIICPECKSSNNKKLFSAFSTSNSSSGSSYDSCASGNCGIDSSNYGGCANGACGLN